MNCLRHFCLLVSRRNSNLCPGGLAHCLVMHVDDDLSSINLEVTPERCTYYSDPVVDTKCSSFLYPLLKLVHLPAVYTLLCKQLYTPTHLVDKNKFRSLWVQFHWISTALKSFSSVGEFLINEDAKNLQLNGFDHRYLLHNRIIII